MTVTTAAATQLPVDFAEALGGCGANLPIGVCNAGPAIASWENLRVASVWPPKLYMRLGTAGKQCPASQNDQLHQCQHRPQAQVQVLPRHLCLALSSGLSS